jgi:hypothetical protein
MTIPTKKMPPKENKIEGKSGIPSEICCKPKPILEKSKA